MACVVAVRGASVYHLPMPLTDFVRRIPVLLLAVVLAAPAAAQTRTVRPKATPAPGPAAPPLVGTISSGAGRVAGPPPNPLTPNGIKTRRIGTRPLGSAVYIPLGVADAPVYNRGGSTLSVETVSSPVVNEPAFYPTPQPPVWRLVKEEKPVQGWRLVDVDDVVCYPSGGCRTVTTRVVARWIPPLRGYGFRDRLGRLWQVE